MFNDSFNIFPIKLCDIWYILTIFHFSKTRFWNTNFVISLGNRIKYSNELSLKVKWFRIKHSLNKEILSVKHWSRNWYMFHILVYFCYRLYKINVIISFFIDMLKLYRCAFMKLFWRYPLLNDLSKNLRHILN